METLRSHSNVVLKRFDQINKTFTAIFGGIWTTRVDSAEKLAWAQGAWKDVLTALSERQFVYALKKIVSEWIDVDKVPLPRKFSEIARSFCEPVAPVRQQKKLETKRDRIAQLQRHIALESARYNQFCTDENCILSECANIRTEIVRAKEELASLTQNGN